MQSNEVDFKIVFTVFMDNCTKSIERVLQELYVSDYTRFKIQISSNRMEMDKIDKEQLGGAVSAAEEEVVLQVSEEDKDIPGVDVWEDIKLPFDLPVEVFPRLLRDKKSGRFQDYKALALLWTNCKAQGTLKSYKTIVNKMTAFFVKQGYNWSDICEFYVETFLKHLIASEATFSTWGSVKGTLMALEKMTEKQLMSPQINEMIEGGKRISASAREPVKKMKPIERKVIEKAVQRIVIPHINCPSMIDHVHFRTIFRWVIYFESLCRFDDFDKLKARHFKIYQDEVEIFFPSRKNDQHHNGHVHVISAQPHDSVYDPVMLIHYYFLRCGFKPINSGEVDENFVNCVMRTSGQQKWADGSRTISRGASFR